MMKGTSVWLITTILTYTLFCSSCKQKGELNLNSGKEEKSDNKIEIIGELEKRFLTSYNQEDYVSLSCSDWNITASQVEKVFFNMKLHDNNIISYLKICYTLPCHYYLGQAIYKGEKYSIRINAASYIVLSNENKKNPLFFILDEESEYFLKACDCCEDNQ